MTESSLPSLKRRARCQKCGHQRYMHEYDETQFTGRTGKKITYRLGPCKSEPKKGVAPLLAHMCGCTHRGFEPVKQRVSFAE